MNLTGCEIRFVLWGQVTVGPYNISRRENVLLKYPGPCQGGRVLANWRVVLLSGDVKAIAFVDGTRHKYRRIAQLEIAFMAPCQWP
jgi:hypothetical protein